MKKTAILAAIALALLFSAALAEGAGVLGQPFPDFTAADTEGNTFTLSEALKDHEAVLINIWATWCPPCESEMSYLNEAYEQYKDRVAFIALSKEPEDSMEKIEAYRQAHGLTLPFGRDENAALYQYLGEDGVPMTAIVDRFGNTGFMQVGCFFSMGEIARTIETFLGDSYTETVTLTAIPKDTSTRAFPTSAVTELQVENETARLIVIHDVNQNESELGYIIHEDTAHLLLKAAAADQPTSMLCYDYRLKQYMEFMELLDPRRNAFVYDAPMPGADADKHYTLVYLLDKKSGYIYTAIYLIDGEEYMDELMKDMLSWGYEVTWEYADAQPAEEAATQAYILHIVDQYNEPVPGMKVNFCTDTTCMMLESDENGTISFSGAQDVYHVQLYRAPEGYSFDPGFELYTEPAYGEWVLSIRKD